MSDYTVENYKKNGLDIEIYVDDMADNPADWGNFTIVQFRDNDFKSYEQLETSEFVTEAGKLTPATLAKLRAGKMFTLSYSRYSNSDGGFYRLDGGIPTGEVDSRDVNGFIVFDDAYVKGISYADRRKYAEQDLQTYTAWANGEVYGYSVTNPRDGDVIDSCCGFYDFDDCKQTADGEAKAFVWPHEAAYAKNATIVHGGK